MSTLKVNSIVTQDLESDLSFKTNDTTHMFLTSAGSLSAQSLSATQLWGDGSKLSNLPGISKYTAAWAVSHGSVTVAQGSTHTITHNLGTTDVTVRVYVNSSASDTDAQSVGDGEAEQDSGGRITSLTSNTIVLQLGSNGYRDWNSSGAGSTVSFASKYIKVVVIG